MTELDPQRRNIFTQDVNADAAVTQTILGRVGQGINFINNRHFYIKEFCINGDYGLFSPNLGVDGAFTYPFDFQIVHVVVSIGSVNGPSGVTELDLKWRPENGVEDFLSVFSVTPKISELAAPFSQVRNGTTVTGFTAPVLSKTDFQAFNQIRFDVLSVLARPLNGVFLTIFSRPI